MSTTKRVRPASATVNDEQEVLPCGACLQCIEACPTGALHYRERVWSIDLGGCFSCGVCASVCPNGLISVMHEAVL